MGDNHKMDSDGEPSANGKSSSGNDDQNRHKIMSAVDKLIGEKKLSEDNLNAASERIKVLESQLADERGQIEDLKHELDEQKVEQEKHLRRANERLDSQEKDFKVKIGQVRETANRANKELEEKNMTEEALKRQNESLQQSVQELNESLETEKQLHDKTKSKNQTLLKGFQALIDEQAEEPEDEAIEAPEKENGPLRIRLPRNPQKLTEEAGTPNDSKRATSTEKHSTSRSKRKSKQNENTSTLSTNQPCVKMPKMSERERRKMAKTFIKR